MPELSRGWPYQEQRKRERERESNNGFAVKTTLEQYHTGIRQGKKANSNMKNMRVLVGPGRYIEQAQGSATFRSQCVSEKRILLISQVFERQPVSLQAIESQALAPLIFASQDDVEGRSANDGKYIATRHTRTVSIQHS